MKRIVIKILNVIAGVAAVVALFTPFHTGTQFLIFGVALIAAIVCAAISGNLDDKNVGYWPEQPKDSTPPQHDTAFNLR